MLIWNVDMSLRYEIHQSVFAIWVSTLLWYSYVLSFLLWKYTLKFQIRFGIHTENSKACVQVFINMVRIYKNTIRYEHILKIEYISKSYYVEYINTLSTLIHWIQRFAHLYITPFCSFVYYFLFLGRSLWEVIIPCHLAPLYTPFISIVYLLQQLWSKPHFPPSTLTYFLLLS